MSVSVILVGMVLAWLSPAPFGPRNRVHSWAAEVSAQAASATAIDVLAGKIFMRFTIEYGAGFYLSGEQRKESRMPGPSWPKTRKSRKAASMSLMPADFRLSVAREGTDQLIFGADPSLAVVSQNDGREGPP